jgi:hypothetical protein
MGKNEKTPINVNGKDYLFEDMTERQQRIVNHINDLNRKVSSSEFNLEQLVFCRQNFINDLAESLEEEAISDEDYIEPTAGD